MQHNYNFLEHLSMLLTSLFRDIEILHFHNKLPVNLICSLLKGEHFNFIDVEVKIL